MSVLCFLALAQLVTSYLLFIIFPQKYFALFSKGHSLRIIVKIVFQKAL